ncbi:hypothetical protein [Candidatus Berkiella aquae]|uniref:Uncharacterized protein n=1 Tax=Candidatus Berkiella aquae TaxID=295108 RepID=A0A0Q9YLL1_9GAMM|nr:hypothetical protein [Candidatus Berkiella aquae]MCS5711528.1 hypothetical protein [Candidatus Berkiella aquae]
MLYTPPSLRVTNESFANLSSLRENQQTDYQEGLMKTDDSIAYIGSLGSDILKPEQTVEPYRAANARANNIGKVLNPEARYDSSTGKNEIWTYQKNQAFMLGAIEARKTFILVTPKNHYKNNPGVTGTIDELLWLKDNGYTFTEQDDGTTRCVPPTSPRSEFSIRNYNNGKGVYKKPLLHKMRDEILGFEPEPVYTPYRNTSYRTGQQSSSNYSQNPRYSTTTSADDNGSWRRRTALAVGN